MISVEGLQGIIRQMLATPRQVERAAEKAIDFTAKVVQSDVQREMLAVFDNPVDYTIKAVKVTLTRGHNMRALVWIATPPRMTQSYLVPQIEGGVRTLKGFERGLGAKPYIPGRGARLNAYGNIPVGTIRNAMAEIRQGTASGRFVRISTRRGRLPPGVYQRASARARGASAGRLTSIMVEGRTAPIRPLLDFYGVARRAYDREFSRRFRIELARIMGR